MRTLVVDIETIGDDWDDLDVVTQEHLTKWADRSAKGATEREILMQDVKNTLGLSPFTGRIVSLGLYDLERDQGAVYCAEYGEDNTVVGSQFVYKQRSEKDMLAEFWEGASEYDTFVTFGGRHFDLPFLLHRSVCCDVYPTVDLMKYRYLTQQSRPFHVDLQDELSFYGAMSKNVSLHMICQTYQIESPKTKYTGDDVRSLYKAGHFREIAYYNSNDVFATASVYKKWLSHLAPASFLALKDIF